MATIDKRPLKAFVRFDGSGRVVAGSLILRKNMPKVGKWQEILAYQCCNPTTTTTTTAVPFSCISYGVSVERGGTGTYTYTPCGDTEPLGPVPIEGPLFLVMCTVAGEITSTGDVVVTPFGECEITTTTTTTTTEAPVTTTTTTTEAPVTTTTTTTGPV
jgi:hypothetical protein